MFTVTFAVDNVCKMVVKYKKTEVINMKLGITDGASSRYGKETYNTI